MPGSLTSGFLWSRWRGKRSRHSRRMRNPQLYVSGKKPMWLGTSPANPPLCDTIYVLYSNAVQASPFSVLVLIVHNFHGPNHLMIRQNEILKGLHLDKTENWLPTVWSYGLNINEQLRIRFARVSFASVQMNTNEIQIEFPIKQPDLQRTHFLSRSFQSSLQTIRSC